MKKIILAFPILFLLLSLVFFYQKIKFDDGKVHLIFCNVGQGDGILIRSNELDVVIDGGPDDSILRCLSNNMPFWDRSIELVLLTHPHADHMTGLISILNNYKVSSFGTEKLKNNTAIYSKLVKILSNKNLKIQYLYLGDSFKISDGLSLKILGPSKEFLDKANPTGVVGESRESGSLLTLLSIGDFNAITTGDTPIDELNEATNSFNMSKINVFQVSHHGSRYNSDYKLISDISPQIAVISVGKNSYGHPSGEVLKILQDLKIPFLRTDQHGDIEIITDGKSFSYN